MNTKKGLSTEYYLRRGATERSKVFWSLFTNGRLEAVNHTRKVTK